MVHSAGQYTTLISVASIVVDALESYGIDSRPIVRKAGFDPDEHFAPGTRVSTQKLLKLWKLAVEYSDDPCFGLTYATYIQPSALHGLGFSWLASYSLKEGLERLVRFQRILDGSLNLAMRETDTGYSIYTKVQQENRLLVFPDAESNSQIASIFKISQIMLGPDIKPVQVSFEHKNPGYRDKFEKFFGIPVIFESAETSIIFDKAESESFSSSSNPELARINDQVVIDYLNRFDKQDVVTQTRKFIIDYLPSGTPKQIDIAKDLNLSLRSFQRKLKQAGSSFTEVLNHVRYETACSYLKSSQPQVIMIAYMLGYSDPSNFARAFKRWNGLTPQEFRENAIYS